MVNTSARGGRCLPSLAIVAALQLTLSLGACSQRQVSLGRDPLAVGPGDDGGTGEPNPAPDKDPTDAGGPGDGGRGSTGNLEDLFVGADEECWGPEILPVCAVGLYCDFGPDAECGEQGEPGHCKAVPTVCTFEYRPVCGCDGVTYPNECDAHWRGASVRERGECTVEDGALCDESQDDDCGRGQYCEPIDGTCGSAGTCRRSPDSCMREPYRPVCGCNGVPYPSACVAHLVGIAVDHEGPCSSGLACGHDSSACPPGEFCDLALGDGCEGDGSGECRRRISGFCPQVYEPVCGCDGTTYPHECVADAAGVSISHPGECDQR